MASPLIEQFAAPFHPTEIEWRIAQAGKKSNGDIWAKAFAYVDNRAIMSRLDTVVGPLNWRTDIRQLAPVTLYKEDWKTKEVTSREEGGFICTIEIRDPANPDSGWVGKTDGANNTDFEPIKGGLSGSMKRAAVSWGIGRYLYDLPEGWALVHDNGVFRSPVKIKGEGQVYINWSPPGLPPWALPSEEYALANMMAFIEAKYNAAKHGDTDVRVAAGNVMPLRKLLSAAKGTWGDDYYLVLFIYEGLKKLLG